MPQALDDNKEDLAVTNAKGDQTTQFAISNWMAYLNTKAMFNNAGAMGHIFIKFKPFTNVDIFQMLGVFISNGLAPCPQLTQKMQTQLKQQVHGNDKITSVVGMGYQ
jgi:hypothetical protein